MTEIKRRLLAARAMSDVAATQSAIVVRLADSLGIFAALRDRAMTADEIAERCDVSPRFAQSALMTLAASGYVDRDASVFSLSPEQLALFADPSDPLFAGGAFELAMGLARSNDAEIREGIARSSRVKFPPLVARKLDERLKRGDAIAELGCGAGATLIELARIYPALRATGIDRSDAAIASAREAASRAGVGDRVTFIYGDEGSLDAFDVVLSLEMLHESPDPNAVARGVHGALRDGGTWLLIEPCGRSDAGNDTRLLASLAALYCLPASGFSPHALGPLASRDDYERVIRGGGFEKIAIEDEGAIHVIIEAQRG